LEVRLPKEPFLYRCEKLFKVYRELFDNSEVGYSIPCT